MITSPGIPRFWSEGANLSQDTKGREQIHFSYHLRIRQIRTRYAYCCVFFCCFSISWRPQWRGVTILHRIRPSKHYLLLQVSATCFNVSVSMWYRTGDVCNWVFLSFVLRTSHPVDLILYIETSPGWFAEDSNDLRLSWSSSCPRRRRCLFL